MPPEKDLIRKFNLTRLVRDTTSLCYAAEVALNFEQNGHVTACCFNREYVLGTYPDQSIQQIWTGEKIRKLREALRDNDLSKGCRICGKMLEEGNFESILIKHFDEYYDFRAPTPTEKKGWWPFAKKRESEPDLIPVTFEFEISNSCNLECIMCGGKWSSSIRKNREGLPPLKSPYDQAFVEQIRAFLPGLRRANFLGGEPFLISVYYEIWEDIIRLNPDITVAITSNGTILPERARKVIESLPNCKITLSIDSLKAATWEQIRRKGEFAVLRENIDYLIGTGKLVSFSVCPMIQNWREIPEIIEFCSTHQLDLYFNIVYGPLGGRIEGIHSEPELKGVYDDLVSEPKTASQLAEPLPEVSLGRLEAGELSEVIAFYEGFRFQARYQRQLNNLVSQLKSWKREQSIREQMSGIS